MSDSVSVTENVQHILKAFEIIDTDNSDSCERSESEAFLGNSSFTKTEVDVLFELIDMKHDGDESISFTELIAFLQTVEENIASHPTTNDTAKSNTLDISRSRRDSVRSNMESARLDVENGIAAVVGKASSVQGLFLKLLLEQSQHQQNQITQQQEHFRQIMQAQHDTSVMMMQQQHEQKLLLMKIFSNSIIASHPTTNDTAKSNTLDISRSRRDSVRSNMESARLDVENGIAAVVGKASSVQGLFLKLLLEQSQHQQNQITQQQEHFRQIMQAQHDTSVMMMQQQHEQEMLLMKDILEFNR